MLRESDVKRVVVGPRSGEFAPRLFLELEDEVLVLPDPLAANMLRAFVWVWNHPTQRVLELAYREYAKEQVKKHYGLHQHVETGRSEREVQRDIDAWLSGAS